LYPGGCQDGGHPAHICFYRPYGPRAMMSADFVNISRPLSEMARLQPDTPAIIFPQEGRSLTFRELDRESDRIAQGLGRIGIVRGTRVALLVPPSPELFTLTFALFKTGAV